MDYKYINQLLERYWNGETTLEEEEILRAFFSQKDIPAELLPYQALFAYGQTEKKANVLGDDFDERILSMIEERKPVKARIIPLGQRLKPLFKAAAVVPSSSLWAMRCRFHSTTTKAIASRKASIRIPGHRLPWATRLSLTACNKAILSRQHHQQPVPSSNKIIFYAFSINHV